MNFHFGVLVLALVLALVAYVSYSRTTPAVYGRLRWLLIGLRVAAFLLIVFLLMDPRYVLETDRSESARVIALLDRSASMSLPSQGWQANTTPTRFEQAETLSDLLGSAVSARAGEFDKVYFSDDLLTGDETGVAPDGQGTDIQQAMESLLKRTEGEHIVGVVVFSDGAETKSRLVRSAPPPVPVFTVGIGDTTAPEDVRISEVDYNTIVRAPSKTSIRVVVELSGEVNKRVQLTLTENGRVLFRKDTLLTADHPELVQEIWIEVSESGKRQMLLEADVDGVDVEEENNRRDIVIEAEKAGVKVLIVDLLPSWELHFLTDFLRKDQTFDFDLVSLVGDKLAPNSGRLKDRDVFQTGLDEYDAIILASVSDAVLSGPATDAIKTFVVEDGKGLLVMPGQSSLFEQPAAWRRLSELLPVRGTPPHRFNLQFTNVRPGAQALSNPITAQLVPLLSQEDWQQRSPLLGFYGQLAPKNGVEVLLETEGAKAPAFIYQSVGKGRVAVLSAGPIWRWKFLAENNTLYDEMVSRLLDVLSRGEDAERFMLTSRRNVYVSGEAPEFVAEVFNEKMQPVTGAPIRLEVSRVDEQGDEVPLENVSMRREGSDNPRYRAAVSALVPGTYRVRGEAELPGRTIRSQPLEISVSNVSVEYQNVSQDRDNLNRIARQSGARYVTADQVADLGEQIALEPRIVASSSELSFRTSLIVFSIILAFLSLEWIIRKRTGMI